MPSPKLERLAASKRTEAEAIADREKCRMTNTLYKVLDNDGSARMGVGDWFLPKGKHPGKWMPPIKGELVPCKNGYHLCREGDLIEWLGPAIFIAEHRGERIDEDDKIVVREARLIERVGAWDEHAARHFACDCAERALKYNDDPRCKKVIEVARAYADGKATAKELRIAEAATWAAARAAGAAAVATAVATAGAAEKEWQTKRLIQYLTGKA